MAKKQTAKASKSKSSLFSKLIPRSSKAKLLTFLVVFSVIGGGVMTYRSFAADGFGVYTPDQMSIVSGNAYRTTSTSGSKNGTPVLVMQSGSKARTSSAIEPVVWAPYIRACVNVAMFELGSSTIRVAVTENGNQIASNSYTVTSTATYKKVCTAFVGHYDPNARVGVQVTNPSGNRTIKVGSVAIEYSDGSGIGKG